MILSLSLHNYFSNTWYSKEDIRSAVKFFQKVSKDEKILSYNEKYTVERYLSESEKFQYFPIQNTSNVIEYIHKFFSVHDISYVYLVLARDWNKIIEKEIYNTFLVSEKQEFNGVKILKICER